jgi:hypothetical protein
MRNTSSVTIAALAFLAFALLVAMAPSTAHGLTNELVCDRSAIVRNPKPYMDLMLPGPKIYNGVHKVEAYIFEVDPINFKQTAIGEFSGTFVQFYDTTLGTYVSEYYINIGGADVLAATMYFVQRQTDKSVYTNDFCLAYEPDDLAPEYQRITPMADNLFLGTYYHKRIASNGGITGPYGLVGRHEWFFIDPVATVDGPGLKSINCLTDFSSTSATINLRTCFRYTKLSNNPVRCAEDDGTRQARQVRNIAEYGNRTIDVGKGIFAPIEVLYPEYRQHYL